MRFIPAPSLRVLGFLVGCGTSGLPSEERRVSFHGARMVAGQGLFTERIALVPGTSFCPVLHAMDRVREVDLGWSGTVERRTELPDA